MGNSYSQLLQELKQDNEAVMLTRLRGDKAEKRLVKPNDQEFESPNLANKIQNVLSIFGKIIKIK